MTYSEVHRLFHRLWSRSVGTPDYNKKDWLQLEAALNEAWRASGRPLTLNAPEEPPGRSVWERLRSWDL